MRRGLVEALVVAGIVAVLVVVISGVYDDTKRLERTLWDSHWEIEQFEADLDWLTSTTTTQPEPELS